MLPTNEINRTDKLGVRQHQLPYVIHCSLGEDDSLECKNMRIAIDLPCMRENRGFDEAILDAFVQKALDMKIRKYVEAALIDKVTSSRCHRLFRPM